MGKKEAKIPSITKDPGFFSKVMQIEFQVEQTLVLLLIEK